MKFFYKYDLHFTLGLALLLSIVLIYSANSRDFGINLFTEMIGVAMTVLIINKIIERKTRKKRISIDIRILNELQGIISNYFSIWKHLVWRYNPDQKITCKKDFLNTLPELIKSCDINDSFHVVSIHQPESAKLHFHDKPIKHCFENYSNTLQNSLESFISDYKLFLEPDLLDLLLKINESQYFNNIDMINHKESIAILSDLGQNTDQLESYISPLELQHIQHFLNLMQYSVTLKGIISKFKKIDFELYAFKNYFRKPEF